MAKVILGIAICLGGRALGPIRLMATSNQANIGNLWRICKIWGYNEGMRPITSAVGKAASNGGHWGTLRYAFGLLSNGLPRSKGMVIGNILLGAIHAMAMPPSLHPHHTHNAQWPEADCMTMS